MRRLILACVLLLALAAFAAPAYPAGTVFARNLAGFNTAAGSPPVSLDFDSIQPGTNVNGAHLKGLTLLGPGSPLVVVRGEDTYMPSGFSGAPNPNANRLLATSGANVLSPDGPELGPGLNPTLESDNLTIVFDTPVSSFGFDHLSQSADGFSFTHIVVKDASGKQIYGGSVPISGSGGGAPGGPDFWGIVSSSADIKTVEITEGDNNSQYPDCNIGFDTFRFFSSTPAAGVNNRDLRDPVVTAAAGWQKFRVWGVVTVLDSESFLLDDGSALPVKVVCPGYTGLLTGDYAQAAGTVNNGVEPPTLAASPGDVTKLN